MTQIATATITGFITAKSPDSTVVSLAGLDIQLPDASNAKPGDLVKVNASVDTAGTWKGRIEMHLSNPIQNAPQALQTAPVASSIRAVAQHTSNQQTAARTPSVTPSASTPSGSSRASRFGNRGAPAAPPGIPHRNEPSGSHAPRPNSRPAFSLDDDMQDVPF